MAYVEKYCSPTGQGAHDGSVGNDWSFTEAIAGVAAGNRVNMIAGSTGTYASTTTTRTIATSGTTIAPIWWRGYRATPGDMDNNAAAVAGTDIPSLSFTTGGINVSGAYNIFSNLDVTGATTSSSLFNANGAHGIMYRCRFRQTAGSSVRCMLVGSANQLLLGCYISAISTQACVNIFTSSNAVFHGCYLTGGNAGLTGTTATGMLVERCVFDAIGGDVCALSTGYGRFLQNSVYAPTGHGFTWSGTPAFACEIVGNHFEAVNQASKAAINNGSGTASMLIRPVNNSYYQCTSNVANNGDTPNIWDIGTIAGSGFANAAGHDFTPSSLLKTLGFPGQYENISAFRGYADLGAAQSQGSGGGYLVGGGLVR